MSNNFEKVEIQWHPGFYGAAELELLANREALEFQREYNLSKKPLQIDLLIIKKLADVQIENEIGRIFKKYNILEYKSPDDGLTIDDYYKTIGYACFYKGLSDRVNQVPADELTLSIFRETYPRELFKALKKSGCTIKEQFPGIYYILGNVLFDTQLVVTGRLSRETHSSLRILSRNADAEDVRTFLTKAKQLNSPGNRHNADAILQASIHANKRLYYEVRRDSGMCEALRELMKDEIDQILEEAAAKAAEEAAKAAEEAAKAAEEAAKKAAEEAAKKAAEEAAKAAEEAAKKAAEEAAKAAEEAAKAAEKAMEEGMEKGMEKGTDNTIITSVRNLMETMKLTAEQAMDAIKVPMEARGKYLSRL